MPAFLCLLILDSLPIDAMGLIFYELYALMFYRFKMSLIIYSELTGETCDVKV